MTTFTKSRPPEIDLLEPGYGPLFDRAVEVFSADERVRALWLSGSLARGSADHVSDLDLLLAVRDDDHDAFSATWKDWLGAITPTVIARPLPFLPGSLYSVTPGRERFDVVVEPVSRLATTPFRTRVVVFDRDGLDTIVPDPEARTGPSSVKLAAIVEEFFRDYGMFPVVVEREDWLLGLEAIHFLRGLIYQLFVEANAPQPPMGAKMWSAKLTASQRGALEALPTGQAERNSVIDAHETVAVAFVRYARQICATHDVPWPTGLEAATLRYLKSYQLPALDAFAD